MSETTFKGLCRALALIAIITGLGDLTLGAAMQKPLGLLLDAVAINEPLLNSQIRFLGAVWFGYGLGLWLALRSISRHSALILGLLAVLVVGGVGRVLALLVNGLPASVTAGGFILFALAIELVLAPVLMLWLSRYAQKQL